MSDFGLTPDGFRVKTQADILSEIEQDEKAEIDPTIDVSPTSPTGQHNAIFTRQLAAAWEVLGLANDALDPDEAEGDPLIGLCKLTGTTPRGDTFSEVICNCHLDTGTTLEAGVAFANVTGKPDVTFTPKADYPDSTGAGVAADGTYSVVFRATAPGPVPAAIGSLNTITSPIVGWSSVTNPKPAELGAFADGTNGDWSALRARLLLEVAAAGSSTALAIDADVLEVEDADGNRTVRSVAVLQNCTDYIDANGLLPHSIEVIVYDQPPMADALIGQTIADNVAAGVRTQGAINSGALRNGQPVYFSRVATMPVYLAFDVVAALGFTASDFKESVVAALSANRPGDSVYQSSCIVAGRGAANVVTVRNVRLGFSPSPTGTADLAIMPRQIATFDPAWIGVTIVSL